MRKALTKLNGWPKTGIAALVLAMAGIANMSAACADEAQAKSLFRAMSDYLGAQKAIALEYDSNLEVVTQQKQKLALLSSGSVTLNRPDKLRATRTGGFASVQLAFDGKQLTLVDRNANEFAKSDAAGTIDDLVDELRGKYHKPVPAADLLMANPYDELMPLVIDAKDLGSGVIRGIECNHLACVHLRRSSAVSVTVDGVALSGVAFSSRPAPASMEV